MKRRFRRQLAASAVAVLAAGTVGTLASTAGATSSSSTSFTYWTSGWQLAEISAIDKAFDAANPGYTANGQFISSSDEYLPKVIAALKSGTQPTVFTDQQPQDLPLLAESGKLIPLNGQVTALTNQLYPGIKSSLFYRGQQLGMALAGEGDFVLFYNKKDFAAAGISRPPTTWTQVVTDAVKLTVPAKHQWGIYIPFGDAEWISFDWEALLWADGGSLLNPNQTAATFDSPAGVKALTTWVDLVHTQKAAPDASYAQAGSFDGAPAFASNAVAMLIDGPWTLSGFEKDKIPFGVSLFPKGTVSSSSNIGIGVVALLKTTAAQDKAGLAFIKFLATPAEGAYLAAESGGLPSSAAQLSQPVLKTAIASNPYYNIFAEQEQTGGVRPISPEWNAISEDLWTEINDALALSVTPTKALQTAAAEADALLKSQS